MEQNKTLNIYTDGGSRGNPGPAAAGFVITDIHKNTLLAKGIYLGQTTNNVAEYTAMLSALQAAKELNAQSVQLYSDSELMVKQIKGIYRVKSENLKDIYFQITGILGSFKSWKITHVFRDKNKHADALVNKALDQKKDITEQTAAAKKTHEKPIRLAILLSGGGRTMLNILEQILEGQLHAEIPIVISSRSSVAGVERAQKNNLKVEIIRKKDNTDLDCFSTEIVKILDSHQVDLVIQAGWLCLWKIPQKYENKVMNIHPALLPSFGGQGMWGHHVHQAVLKRGCKISGCTVHFCSNEYDKGPIIIQKSCPAYDTDTPDTLAQRVFELECQAYPQAIKLFYEKKLSVRDGIVKIKQ